MARFKKGSPEAKAYMAKIRKKMKKNKPAKKAAKKTRAPKPLKKSIARKAKKQSLSGIAKIHFSKGLNSLTTQYGDLCARLLSAGSAKVKREINKQIKEAKKKISVLNKLK